MGCATTPGATHLTVSYLAPGRSHTSPDPSRARAQAAVLMSAVHHATRGAQTIRRGQRLWGVRQGAVLLLHPCALARRRRGSGAVSVRARGAPQSSRHLPAEGQRPRVDHGRGSTAASVSARGGSDRAGAGGTMRRRRTSAARPHDSSRAHARPLCSQPTSPGRSARAGAWGGCGPRLVERAAEPEV